jgi:copper chaperone NosL
VKRFMKRMAFTFLFALLVGAGLSCKEERATTAKPVAEKPERASCAVCGMVVREQLPPRVQVVHRDGKRVFLCALSEVDAYLSAPSPHGNATEVFVEVLPPDQDPLKVDAAPLQWVPAPSAHFVLEGPKRRVMGASVLAYESHDAAQGVASRHGGRVVDFSALRGALKAPPGETK